MISWIAMALAAAGCSLLLTKPRFTATAGLLTETRRAQLGPSESGRDSLVDMAVVESQLETIKSDNIARLVIDKLKLWDDPEFAPKSGWLQRSTDAAAVESRVPEIKRQTALTSFKRAMRVTRTGRSYMIEVSFTSLDPQRAAAVANAVAEAYIEDQFSAKRNNAQRAGQWMEERIAKLRQQAVEAAQAVEDLKSRNNIIVDAQGRLASERELEELSTSLARARAETSQARARVDRMQGILKVSASSEGSAATVPVVADELSNQVILRLRQQYVDIAKQEAEWSTRMGRDHSAAVNLRGEMNGLQQSIWNEVQRITAAYASDLQIAESRERSIEARMTEVFQQTTASRQGLVKLRELETQAETYKSLYEHFLTRQMQNVEQQSFPVMEARIVSAATPPLEKSSPKATLVLLLAGLAGTLGGIGAATRREYVQRLVRTPSDLELDSDVAPLGTIPVVPGRLLFPARRRAPPLLLHDHLDTLRGVKVTVDEACKDAKSRVVGVVSAGPSEGKSTIAFNLAALTAEDGGTTLLIDANLHHPSLTRGLADSKATLVDVVEGRAALSDAVVRHELGFDFVGANKRAATHASLVLSSAGMRELIAAARREYDYVILDLPNMRQHVDVRAAADQFDTFVLVAEWGRTSAHDIVRAIRASSQIAERLAGALINKAPPHRY